MKLSAKVDRVIKIKDGRTSTEYIKLDKDTSELNFEFDGDSATHTEFVVVDRVGRLQIPAEMLEKAQSQPMSRVSLKFDENNHIVLIPFE